MHFLLLKILALNFNLITFYLKIELSKNTHKCCYDHFRRQNA